MAKIKKPTSVPTVAPVANVADVPPGAGEGPKETKKERKKAPPKEYAQFGQVRVLKQPEPDPIWTPQGENYKVPPTSNLLEVLAWAVSSNLDVLLLGDTGTGKTSAVRYMAQELNERYRRFPMSDATDVTALIGQMLINEQGTFFQKGVVYDCMETGKWLLLDEINAALPEIRLRLNSIYAIDEGVLIVPENEGEVIPRHKHFRLFATANPYSYAGVKEMNQAIMSRFDVVLWIDYLPETTEHELLLETVRVKPDVGMRMVKAANKVRQARKTDQEIRFPMSFREIRAWAMAAQRFGVAQAAEFTVVRKCDEPDQGPVRELLRSQFAQGEWRP
jgi:cobaltochelatase CobS